MKLRLQTQAFRPMLAAAVTVAVLLSGCATYVDVETVPEGAVIVDSAGHTHGIAPLSIEYDRSALEAAGGAVPGLTAKWPSGAEASTSDPLIVTDFQYGLKVRLERPKGAPGLEEDLQNALQHATERAKQAEAERDRMQLYLDHGWGWGPGWGFGWGIGFP